MTRRSLTALQRLKVFEAAQGICHICLQRIQVGQAWEVEHVTPLALGGSNVEPAHKTCHVLKTVKDIRDIAKVKRIAAKHHGAAQSKWPKSKWKRKVSGEVVER